MTIDLNGRSVEVIGVMPAGFDNPFGSPADLWTPHDLRLGGSSVTLSWSQEGSTLPQRIDMRAGPAGWYRHCSGSPPASASACSRRASRSPHSRTTGDLPPR